VAKKRRGKSHSVNMKKRFIAFPSSSFRGRETDLIGVGGPSHEGGREKMGKKQQKNRIEFKGARVDPVANQEGKGKGMKS